MPKSIHDLDPDDVENPDAYCPKCGTRATDESITNVTLSDLGYHHKDVQYQCQQDGCQNTWVKGIPIGHATEYADDLTCPECASPYLVHRIEQQQDGVKLHLKCPQCYNFDYTHRQYDGAGRALVGYPQITGELNPDKPYGFDGDAITTTATEVPECSEPLCILHGTGTIGCPNSGGESA